MKEVLGPQIHILRSNIIHKKINGKVQKSIKSLLQLLKYL